MAVFDKIDYWHEKAYNNYLYLMNKKAEELTEEDEREIQRYAGCHIGFFFAWLIKHHFEGEIHREENKEALEAVRREEMSGVDFFIDHCDGKFWEEDAAEGILPFVEAYYEKYFSEYANWVVNELGDLPLEFAGSWEDYHRFEAVLDQAYASFQECGGQ